MKSISFAAPSPAKYGVTVCRPSGMRTSVAVVIGRILPFSSRLNCGSGRPRRSAATSASIASSGSATSRRSPARIASIVSSSRSIRSISAIEHLSPQRLQTPPLKLFDGAFAAADLFRDLADALFLPEAHHDDAPLVGGKAVDGTEEHRAPLDVVVARLRRSLRQRTRLAME